MVTAGIGDVKNSDSISIGIVTALPKELAAMSAMLDNISQFVNSRGRTYSIGSIPAAGGGTHQVALVLADQGTAAATNCATLLIEDFLQIDAVLMVGIAGGVPYVSKPERHVRLGDIVVTGEQGIIAYDFVKDLNSKLEPRHPPRPPHAKIYQASRRLEAGVLAGAYPWLSHMARAASLPNAIRPSDQTDELFDTHDREKIVAHPVDSLRKPGEPRIFIGTIGCANRLLKNPSLRDQIRDNFGILAVEMEGFGIAEASWAESLGYFVVRGICDYCDMQKGNDWQGYASIAAAAYTRALLEQLPTFNNPSKQVTREIKTDELTEDTLRNIANALLSSGTPPALLPLFQDANTSAQRAISSLEKTPRTIIKAGAKDSTTVSLESLAFTTELHHMVVAPPGSGKTHALWHASKRMLSSGSVIPLYISAGHAKSWDNIAEHLTQAIGNEDILTVVRDRRVCIMLDGWSEFLNASLPGESQKVMQFLYQTRVVANGRRGINPDPRFQTWELEPLTFQDVEQTLKVASISEPTNSKSFIELLRLPLALSLYVLLEGKATSRGELISTFHRHLSRGFPEVFEEILSGAIASVDISGQQRSFTELERGLQSRSRSRNLDNPKTLLTKLGTIEKRGTLAVPIHDLYWSWLSGVGLLQENLIRSAISSFSYQESMELALESGATPTSASINGLVNTDIIIAAKVCAFLDTTSTVRTDVHNRAKTYLASSSLVERFRGALAALSSNDSVLLTQSLSVLAEVSDQKFYFPIVDKVINLDFLYAQRDVFCKFSSHPIFDRILEKISQDGDKKWCDWLENTCSLGKVPITPGVLVTALACSNGIPNWVLPHLEIAMSNEPWRLRPLATRVNNQQLAQWIFENYSKLVDNKSSGWTFLNRILVKCSSDTTFDAIVENIESMSEHAQELICFAIKERGEPWISHTQKKVFKDKILRCYHQIGDTVSLQIDDATAEKWIASPDPKLQQLGWRALINRHNEKTLPRLIESLPTSFNELHEIPALKAMSFISNAPDIIVDELWSRIRGTMQPMAMDDVINALATNHSRGIPSLVAVLARNPFFLPSYHFLGFLRHFKNWKIKTGLSFQVNANGKIQDFGEWIVLTRLSKDQGDVSFGGRLSMIQEIVTPILLRAFELGNKGCIDMLVSAGGIQTFNEKIVTEMLSSKNNAKNILKLFSKILDSFPESVMHDLLDSEHIEFAPLLSAVAASCNPLHRVFHERLVKKVLTNPMDIWHYRYIGQILAKHQRNDILSIMKSVFSGVQNIESSWLIREIEFALGNPLIDESSNWIE